VKTATHATAFDGLGTPDVVRVEYDRWELRITVRFQQRAPVYVVFADVVAFRVLDERALLAYWGSDVRSPGWLWKVTEGGWIQQDIEDGITRELADGQEYLVTGNDDCVGVISSSQPTVYCPDAG
jgi:hypothetical protein